MEKDKREKAEKAVPAEEVKGFAAMGIEAEPRKRHLKELGGGF